MTVLSTICSQAALAYIGPGLGAGALAVIVGIFTAIGLAIFTLFWYPIKRLLGLGRRPQKPVDDAETNRS